MPALVNCAVPSTFTSVQYVAAALQNFTVPFVTGVDPETTVAVRVTTPVDGTTDAGLPPELTDNAVVELEIAGSVYVACATDEEGYPEATAMASRVSVELTVIAQV